MNKPWERRKKMLMWEKERDMKEEKMSGEDGGQTEAVNGFLWTSGLWEPSGSSALKWRHLEAKPSICLTRDKCRVHPRPPPHPASPSSYMGPQVFDLDTSKGRFPNSENHNGERPHLVLKETKQQKHLMNKMKCSIKYCPWTNCSSCDANDCY